MCALLDKSSPIRVDRQPRKSGGPRLVYIFMCSEEGCHNEVKVRSTEITRSKGRCQTHAHTKRPFESIYNGIRNDWRRTPLELSYEEFLEFTLQKQCHYCSSPISWQPYGTVDGEFISRAYFLDRKDNEGSYSKDNCVVCCSRCNIMRGNRFTYDEFLLLVPALRSIERLRNSSQAKETICFQLPNQLGC